LKFTTGCLGSWAEVAGRHRIGFPPVTAIVAPDT
jgi:hypothetical protein